MLRKLAVMASSCLALSMSRAAPLNEEIVHAKLRRSGQKQKEGLIDYMREAPALGVEDSVGNLLFDLREAGALAAIKLEGLTL